MKTYSNFKKYSVVVVGLGNIGMMYDYDDPVGENCLTHAKSFNNHPDFEIKYLVDINLEKINLAKKRYPNISSTWNIEEISKLPDIVVLASLPKINSKIFNELKDREEIKLFLLEKPFWNDELNYLDLEKYSDKCVINYTRKYIPLFQNLKNRIESGVFGRPLGAHIWYSKGLRNNGSHSIDLINYFFASSYNLESIKIINTVNDHNSDDLSVTFSVEYNFGGNIFSVIFQIADERVYSLFEIDLLFEKSRFRIFDFGYQMEIYEVQPYPLVKGYKKLVLNSTEHIDFNRYGYYMCEYISALLKYSVKNISSLQQEYLNYKLIEAVKKKVKYE